MNGRVISYSRGGACLELLVALCALFVVGWVLLVIVKLALWVIVVVSLSLLALFGAL